MTNESPTKDNAVMELSKTDKQEPKLSRVQLRQIERAENEAKQVYNSLGQKFVSFLVNGETVNEETIAEKKEQLSKQWKFYCRNKGLSPKVLGLIDTYCDNAIKEFNKEAE